MVTILPIDVDDDLVRHGLGLAIAERVREALRDLDKQAAEMAASGIVDREKWNTAFDGLVAIRDTMAPVLEYARAFEDQWPEEGNEAQS